MNFKSFAKSEIDTINKSLNTFLFETKKKLIKVNPLLGELFDNFIEINQDGKRLRALLVKLGYLMFGGDNIKAITDPMLAVEIFHSAILAHDDIIDQSELRRGKPTMHHALGNDHHAISQTIVMADYGFFLANKLIAESDFEEIKKNQAFQIFNNIVLDTAVGEILDVEIPYRNLDIVEKDSLNISLFKTARYTFTGPLQIGAALAGAKKRDLEGIKQFGDDLGIAFQIQDDILGVFGEVDETGKSNISDIQEGKVTLLSAAAFRDGSEYQKKQLKNLYGKTDLDKSNVEQVKQMFTDTGALDSAYNNALKYTQSAISKIDDLKIDQEYKSILKELADFLMERKK
jgi:geranylgeranyl diphosphate synthase type I